MSTDPRWLAAQQRYVAENTEDETPDTAFARRVVAAYEMYQIQTGREVPKHIGYADALGAYGLLAVSAAA